MLDCEGINYRIHSFDQRHGNFVVKNGWLLFQDGARREVSILGPLIEPSEDPYERSGYILRYHEIKLAKAIEEFESLKHLLLVNTKTILNERNCPPPPANDTDLKELRSLQKKVKAAQAAVEKAQKQREEAKPERLKLMEQASEENRKRGMEVIAEIQRIEI